MMEKLLENFSINIDNIDKNKIKRIFLCTFLCGLIAHGYCFLNSNFSGDSLNYLYKESYDIWISLGRYVSALYRLIKGNIALPAVNGFLSLLYMSISFYMIFTIVKISDKKIELLLCAILTTNYSVSLLNATYIHDSDFYALSLLFSVLGVFIDTQFNKNNKYTLVVFLCFLFSLGIYQAYIGVALILYLIDYLTEITANEDSEKNLKNLLFKYSLVAIAMVAYFAIYKLSLKIFNINEYTGYNSVSNALKITPYVLFYNLYLAVDTDILWVIKPLANQKTAIIIFNILIFCTFIILYLLILAKSKKRKIDLFILALLIPFSINPITIIWGRFHELTIYPLFFFYVLFIVIFQISIKKNILCRNHLSKLIICFIFTLIVFDNVTYSNKLYIKKDLEKNETISICTRILNRIEMTDDYVVGETPVVFVGDLNKSILLNEREGFDYSGVGEDSNYQVFNSSAFADYFNYYLGYKINIVNYSDSLGIDESIIDSMQSFPYKDSVKFVGKYLVVKIS